MTTHDKNTLIPVVSNPVILGDPLLKKKGYEKISEASCYTDNLNQRIDELESAIGQDDSTSIARAYAIREEASRLARLASQPDTVSKRTEDKDAKKDDDTRLSCKKVDD